MGVIVSTAAERKEQPSAPLVSRVCSLTWKSNCAIIVYRFLFSSFCCPQGFVNELSICSERGRPIGLRHGGRMVDESGRGWRLAGSTPLCPGRTPLSPRATTNGNLANTPATPPTSTGRYTGSPSRKRLRSVTGCVRLSATTPKTRTGKRLVVNSGARVRGSGGGSGNKRVRAKARAPPRGGLQPQVEQR